MRKMLLLLSAFAVAFPCASSQLPEDSVVNGYRRGRSKAEIAVGQNVGFSYIMKAVPLASWAKDDHMSYGPFSNSSDMIVRITIESIGDKDWSEFGAWIDGNKIQTRKEGLQFDVPAGSTYSFSVKDRSVLTVSVNRDKASASEIGLPPEVNFLRPQGKLNKCIIPMGYESGNDDGTGNGSSFAVSGPVYIYEAGSMSDGSICLDFFNRLNPHLTIGVNPPVGGFSCEQVFEYLNYTVGSCHQ